MDFSAASAAPLPHLQSRNNISPCLAKHFEICTAKQGEGGVFTFLETGSSTYTQNNEASAQNSGAEGAVADAAGTATNPKNEEG